MAKSLLFDVQDQIAFITLNRPERLNALDIEMSTNLLDAFEAVENDPNILVAVLAATGRGFCSGMDMADTEQPPPGPTGLIHHRTYIENGVKRFKPVIGAVQGYALGAGALLAVQGCDIVIAGESALFGFPEGRAGFALPPMTAMPYLPFKISLEFMILGWKGGELMGPQRARELGMINRVVPDREILAEAIRYAELIKFVPPLYIKSIKAAHYKPALAPTSLAELNYIDYVHPQVESADLKELRTASAERRAPKFTGQ